MHVLHQKAFFAKHSDDHIDILYLLNYRKSLENAKLQCLLQCFIAKLPNVLFIIVSDTLPFSQVKHFDVIKLQVLCEVCLSKLYVMGISIYYIF